MWSYRQWVDVDLCAVSKLPENSEYDRCNITLDEYHSIFFSFELKRFANRQYRNQPSEWITRWAVPSKEKTFELSAHWDIKKKLAQFRNEICNKNQIIELSKKQPLNNALSNVFGVHSSNIVCLEIVTFRNRIRWRRKEKCSIKSVQTLDVNIWNKLD